MIFTHSILVTTSKNFVAIIQNLVYTISQYFETLDQRLIFFVNNYGLSILRISLSIIFIWFGLLKILNESPVTPLVPDFLYEMLPVEVFIFVLGIIEFGIGTLLIFKRLLRIVIAILVIHLVSTFSLLILIQNTMVVDHNPLLLTLEGEFILKNLVLIAGVLVTGSTLHPISTNDN